MLLLTAHQHTFIFACASRSQWIQWSPAVFSHRILLTFLGVYITLHLIYPKRLWISAFNIYGGLSEFSILPKDTSVDPSSTASPVGPGVESPQIIWTLSLRLLPRHRICGVQCMYESTSPVFAQVSSIITFNVWGVHIIFCFSFPQDSYLISKICCIIIKKHHLRDVNALWYH